MSSNEKRDLERYCACMNQVKWRLSLIDAVLSSGLSEIEEFNVEVVALQLRKVMELIALSSLVANKSSYLKVYGNIQKQWNARTIVRDIERVNPGFFPRPIRFSHQDKETNVKHFSDLVSGFLTKEDLVFLYDRCGAVMHAVNPFTSGHIVDIKRPVKEWVSRIRNLLATHRMSLVNSERMWVVVMDYPPDGKVHALTAVPKEATAPSTR